jgi:hypothetical protein
MIIRRVVPMSAAKIAATLYALMGLIFGAIISIIALATGGAFSALGGGGGMAGMLFGTAAIVILPIIYACFGFIFVLIGAALYNLVAGWVGGIQFEVQQ